MLNMYHVALFAYFLDKLRSTPDGDGTLLDHSLVLYGSGMSDGNQHNHTDLPILLAGGASGRLKGGRHLRHPKNTPMANLLVAMLDKLEVTTDKLGDSTGPISSVGERTSVNSQLLRANSQSFNDLELGGWALGVVNARSHPLLAPAAAKLATR